MTTITINVNSSFINQARYNTEELTLDVRLVNGRAYRYSDVGFDVFEELEASESAGVFFNDNIRYVFDCHAINYIGTGVVPATTHVFQSSFLNTAQYNSNNGTCTVTLNNGRAYTYELALATYYEFISAQSAGTYFNNFISRLATRVA